jgi:HK97 family phage prohead protease
MTETLTRIAPDLELSRSGDGRTVCGIIAPFNRATTVDDGAGPYREAFVPGSFAKTIAERGHKVQFRAHHAKRTNPLGVASLLREDAAGVYGEFRVSKTQAGDEVLELVNDGALDSFSVGFAPLRSRKANGIVERIEVALREVSIVCDPAYSDAVVMAVREETSSGLSIAEARARFEALSA